MEADKEILNKLSINYVQQLPLMGSPIPLTLILISYYLFILKIGPNLMKNRPAYDLKKLLMFYNAVQVLFSSKFVYDGINVMTRYGLFDRACLWQEDYAALLSQVYCVFLVRFLEIAETIFFVLRKKQNQVTFLHVYHHSIVILVVWTCMKYEQSYIFAFPGTLNSFVHTVMYTYYGLAAIPAMRKYLWWKKYLTTFQLIQFGLCFVHVTLFMLLSNCSASYILFLVITFNILLFTFLFSKFYIEAYLRKGDTKIDFGRLVCSKVDQFDNFDVDNVNNNDKNKSL